MLPCRCSLFTNNCSLSTGATAAAIAGITACRRAVIARRHFAMAIGSPSADKRHSEQRDYNAAIAKLNTLQSNFAILDAIRKSGRRKNQYAISGVVDACRRIGYKPTDFDPLRIVHIAGTKGKGSTSAFISSILCQYIDAEGHEQLPSTAIPLRKVGLYTSPHLRSVRERIQINHEPLSEEKFAQYFFEVWDRLEASEADPSMDDTTDTTGQSRYVKPVYFRYLTIMAFHAFLREGVDTAVFECGVGGEYDSTNVLVCPSVAGVTNLGIDHTNVLGESIEEIAWHKAGIFKPESATGKAFTVASQPPQAMKVLQQRAAEKEVELHVVERHPEIDSGLLKLGLAADFQKVNASLAVAITAAHLQSLGYKDLEESISAGQLPRKFRRGLETTSWAGRCEVRQEGKLVWHLDGGHTLDSIKLAARWFSSVTPAAPRSTRRILLFNQQTRDATALARMLRNTLEESLSDKGDISNAGSRLAPLFTDAIFCTNVTYSTAETPSGAQSNDKQQGGRYKADLMSINTSQAAVSQLTVQKALAESWHELDKGCRVHVKPTIEDAIRSIRQIAATTTPAESPAGEGEGVAVFVTGSLHLVGGVLEVLATSVPETES